MSKKKNELSYGVKIPEGYSKMLSAGTTNPNGYTSFDITEIEYPKFNEIHPCENVLILPKRFGNILRSFKKIDLVPKFIREYVDHYSIIFYPSNNYDLWGDAVTSAYHSKINGDPKYVEFCRDCTIIFTYSLDIYFRANVPHPMWPDTDVHNEFADFYHYDAMHRELKELCKSIDEVQKKFKKASKKKSSKKK